MCRIRTGTASDGNIVRPVLGRYESALRYWYRPVAEYGGLFALCTMLTSIDCFTRKPFLSVQSAFTGPDREAAGSCVVFAQTLGGVSVTLSQTIYINCFKQYITDLRIPALRPDILIAAGATGFRDIVPAKLLPVVAHVGVAAIRRSLIPVTVTAGIAFLATFAIPFTPLAKVRPQSGEDGVEKSQDS